VRIRAAGRTWIVEQQALTRNPWDTDGGFSGVTFRRLDYASDQVHVRWLRKPERLTPSLAHELFEIAGVRAWRDPRDGRLYELRLDATSLPASRARLPAPLQVIRFHSSDGEAEAPWTLGKPLGWATDGDLIRLLDRALEERASREVPSG
jgi:hypothetical protein